jgi:UPF0755 protein
MKWLKNPWVLLLLLLAAAYGGYNRIYQPIFAPNVQTEEGKPQEFFIYTGWDYQKVGESLMTQKLIRDVESFHWVAEQMNYPRHVYPGRYLIEEGMSTRELVQLLRSGKQTPLNFTFVKFRTTDQLAEYVGEQLEMSARDLKLILNDAAYLKRFNGLRPEIALTIFIPNTYELYWNVEPKEFVDRMYEEYKRFWNDTRNRQREALNLSRLEVMTLASIVEEETNQKDEKATVAGVYLNRVRRKWPLEADPTVKFAVGDFTLRRILNSHLQIDSPYNTYLYPGIPPGPICTPSISSIDAVLNAKAHDYMFFCARADGSGYHHFSETLAQHNAYAREYHRMLNQQGVK